MANPQLSEESTEKIATVFQNYAVNPVESRIGKALKDLEKKLKNSDNQDCLENTLVDKADSISRTLSSIKSNTHELQETLRDTTSSLDNLERRLLSPETGECLEKVLRDQAAEISNSISGAKTDLAQHACELKDAFDKTNISIDKLTERLINPETEDCLEKVLRDQAAVISNSISSAKANLVEQNCKLQTTSDDTNRTLNNLKKRLVDPETDGCLETLLLSETKAIADSISTLQRETADNHVNLSNTLTSISSQIKESGKNTTKALDAGVKDLTASVKTLETHWDTNAQKQEKNILDSVEGRKREIVATLETINEDVSKQHDHLQTALDLIRTEFEEQHQKYSQEQNEKNEQTKADILLAISAESEKLVKIMRISWAISGVSVLGMIATLIVLLIG